MPASPSLDTNDIQGLVATRVLPAPKAARYTLLRILDVEAARTWLSTVAVSSAADRGRPSSRQRRPDGWRSVRSSASTPRCSISSIPGS